ncbi:MAG: hypothetical protein JRJ76_01635 [Deltaproteobacteria bacterium]|nr:hypothetical protein [Deltaproteobacteria bacterium]
MPVASVELRNVIVFSFLAFCVFLFGCGDTPTSTGGDTPVTTQRLTTARLTDIREGLSWTFADSVVVIENKGQLIPSDLVQTLLGGQSTCKCIEATWQLSEKSGLLRLSSMKVDGEKTDTEATISIKPAGHVRVNLGIRQYNVFPNEVKEP